jgi:hypothetical protein
MRDATKIWQIVEQRPPGKEEARDDTLPPQHVREAELVPAAAAGDLSADGYRTVFLPRHAVERLRVDTGTAGMPEGVQWGAPEMLFEERSHIPGDENVAVDPETPVVLFQISVGEDLDALSHTVGIRVVPVEPPDVPAVRWPPDVVGKAQVIDGRDPVRGNGQVIKSARDGGVDHPSHADPPALVAPAGACGVELRRFAGLFLDALRLGEELVEASSYLRIAARAQGFLEDARRTPLPRLAAGANAGRGWGIYSSVRHSRQR